MSIIAKRNKKVFTPAPEELHSAVCCDVVDLGLQQTPWGGSHKVEVRWQLENHDPKAEKPFMVVQRYTLSLHAKSLLRPMLEAWRGQKLKADELEGLEVIHNIKDGGEVYTRIQVVVPPAKGASKLRICRDYIRVADREKRADCERIQTAEKSPMRTARSLGALMGKRHATSNGHFYEAEGESYPLVTTIASVIGKPALVPWASKVEREMVLAALSNVSISSAVSAFMSGSLRLISNSIDKMLLFGCEEFHHRPS